MRNQVKPYTPPRRRRIRGHNYELIIESTDGGMDGAFNVWGSEFGTAFQSAMKAMASIDDLGQEEADMIVRTIKHGVAMLRPTCVGVNWDAVIENLEPPLLIESK